MNVLKDKQQIMELVHRNVCSVHPSRRLKHNIQVISHTHKIEVRIPLLTFCHIFIKGIIFDTQQVEPDGIRPAKEPS